MAMNPFENIFKNLFSNSIFAPPRAVQGVERAAALENEALAAKQAQELAARQALMRGLQGVAGITGSGTLQRPEVINQVLSNPELMNDLIVKGGLEKPEDFLKIFEGLTAKPFEQTNIASGGEVWAPSPLGYPELIRRNPTAEQVDTKDKQVQAAARAEGIGLLSQWLGKGLTRQQVYEKAIGDKQFRKKYIEEGQGKEESLKTLLELGTPKPMDPTLSSPGSELLVPDESGKPKVAHRTPTAAMQRYAEIEERHGPEVAQELFRIAGPDMNPTEKQTMLRELMKANPGNKDLENLVRKIGLGIITSQSVFNPITGKMEAVVIDFSQPEAAETKAPVSRPRSPGPSSVGAPAVGQQPQQGAAGQQAPYLPQFTPPQQLPSGMTMPAGDAAFELGPAGAVQSVFNNILAPFGFAKTNVKREDAVAAFNTLADVTREYFQNSGRPLAADVQHVISRLPKSGGFAQGTFQTPLKTLSQLKSLRRQIEKDMAYYGGILAKPDKYHNDVVKQAQEAFTRGENAIQYFPTDEEFDAHIARAKKLEAEGPKGVGAEIMKRWNESFQGGQEIKDFMGGEEEEKETLKEKEERLQRELDALDAPIDDMDDPSEMEFDDTEQDTLPFEPDDDKGRFAPNPNEREKELLKELESLEELGYQQPVPMGDGTFVEPAGQTTVTGPDGQPISIEERRQQIIEELGVIADQKALHKRRLQTELSSVKAAQQTGLPEEVFHAAAGVQSQLAEMTALPAAAVRNALIAVGAAKIMNPEWQSGRSTESLVKDYWAARGQVVDIPEGSMSGKIGEGAFLGATLAFGFAVAGPRIAAAKGPKAMKATKEWIGRLFSESKGVATATGATGGAASGAAGEQAKRMGADDMGQGAAEIAAGLFSPGAGMVRTVSRGGKALGRVLKPPKPQPKMRPEGPGAELVQDFGRQVISASVNKAKAQKGVLASFTSKDPDKAIDKIFSGPNPEASMRSIIAVTRKSADAREGLRRGVMDWLFRASNLKSPNFTPAQFEKVWGNPSNQRALRLVLPKTTVERIEKLIAAERKVTENSAVLKKLRPSKKTMAAEGVSTAVTGMPGIVYVASILGKVGGSVGMKHLGGRTLVAQSAGAQVGRGAMTKLLSGLSSFASPDALLREALIDPRFEQVLLRKAMSIDAADTAKVVRAGRAGSAGAGVEQAFEKDVKTRGVVDD